VTEAEWLGTVLTGNTYPEPMLRFLGKASERKLRLFACACVRRQWSLVEPIEQQAVAAAERFADGQATGKELKEARFNCRRQGYFSSGAAAYKCASPTATQAARLAQEWAWRELFCHREETGDTDSERTNTEEGAAQAHLLRDIFRPFRPATISPTWSTPQAVALAQAAYDQREMPSGNLDPTRLAVLTDALEDAGCDNPDLLGHLRGPGPHVRGCWVVDLLLGKE
jgi:hypothetical protein